MQKKISICLLTFLLFLNNCGGRDMFTFPSSKDVPVDSSKRVEKNIEEGRGFSLGNSGNQGGVFDFASSNEMWRSSIEVLDFVSFTNASYSGGIIITDWFSGNTENDGTNSRELKITVRFFSNEVRADGIKVTLHEKICSSSSQSDCKIQKIQSEITNQIKLAILKKASIYQKESEKNSKNKKKNKRKAFNK